MRDEVDEKHELGACCFGVARKAKACCGCGEKRLLNLEGWCCCGGKRLFDWTTSGWGPEYNPIERANVSNECLLSWCQEGVEEHFEALTVGRGAGVA